MKTTKIILILLNIILISSTMLAQSPVTIGAKAGFSSSSFRGAGINDVDRQNNLNGGVFINFSSRRGVISLQPELLINPKGGTYNLGPVGLEEEFRITYIEVPVLLKLAIPIDETIYPNIFAGPYAAFRVSQSYRHNGLMLEDDTDPVDYGAIFGAGLDFRGERLFFGIDGRYALGANELRRTDEAEDIKNGTFSINLGIGVILR